MKSAAALKAASSASVKAASKSRRGSFSEAS